ncbi:hypothetical protein DsansV1_C13g0120051 [Dioscorea sansibarensis]
MTYTVQKSGAALHILTNFLCINHLTNPPFEAAPTTSFSMAA